MLWDYQEEVEPCWRAGRIHGTSVSPLRSFECSRSRPALAEECHDLKGLNLELVNSVAMVKNPHRRPQPVDLGLQPH